MRIKKQISMWISNMEIFEDIKGYLWISEKDKQMDIYVDICVGYKGINWDIIGLLSWI
jgi:hypothetical protein